MTDELPRLHSAEYFGEARDYWWNADFLALLARRWRLDAVRRVLDVGCGLGHWGRALWPHLANARELIGIDREPEWIARATAIAAARGLDDRLTYEHGVVEAIPGADDRFDLVTCQTVLIHVPDVRAALREMIRVTRPGGRVIAAEPNNLSNVLLAASPHRDRPIDEQLRVIGLQMTCERGKAALGLGDNSVGERLVAWFVDAGLTNVEVYLSDRAAPLWSPYASDAQRAGKAELADWAARDIWIWDRAETERYFLAGGGDPAGFDALWQLALASARREAAAFADGTYETAGGQVTYVISGVKPGADAPR